MGANANPIPIKRYEKPKTKARDHLGLCGDHTAVDYFAAGAASVAAAFLA